MLQKDFCLHILIPLSSFEHETRRRLYHMITLEALEIGLQVPIFSPIFVTANAGNLVEIDRDKEDICLARSDLVRRERVEDLEEDRLGDGKFLD